MSVEELLVPGEIEAAFERVCKTSGEFLEACIALELDPARDFRFSNLRDVDFSGADLRGFDFQAADLRGSYGADVIFDSSTNFKDADLQGSCFATYYREVQLFRSNPMAGRMYRALFEEDPFEISAWLHQRFRNRRESHSILRRADADTAAILCQKLLADNIDLTKRTDLFYFLRSITGSPIELRELMLSIFARQSENTSLIEKFAMIASSLHRDDPDVRSFVLQLCSAKSPRIRKAAFKASFNTGIFMQNFEKMKALLLQPENEGIRKDFILQAAIGLGRSHVSAINYGALLDGVEVTDVLDLHEFFDKEMGKQVASVIRKRIDEIEARLDPGTPAARKLPRSTPVNVDLVFERQADVLSSAPVLNIVFAVDHPDKNMAAKYRIAARKERQRRAADEQTRRSYRRW